MSYTTLADYREATGEQYTAEQERQIARLLNSAERLLTRAAGSAFYDIADPAAESSEEWREAVILITQRLVFLDNPTIRRLLASPFEQEKIGDYSYKLKKDADSPLNIGRVVEIVAKYATGAEISAGLTLAGPSRLREEQGLSDEEDFLKYDYSRRVWERF